MSLKLSTFKKSPYTPFPLSVVVLFITLAATTIFLTFTRSTKISFQGCCPNPDLTHTDFDATQKTAYFEGAEVKAPLVAENDANIASQERVLDDQTNEDERWIEVDLSDQTLTAHEGSTIYLESKISSGLPRSPTPTGEFRIWSKIKYTRMEGGEGAYYYNLPNVPYVMFFENSDVAGMQGYSLHGAYWHNDFGHTHSHGCVNLPIPIAKKLFYWANPIIPQDKSMVRSSDQNLGTRVVIHT